jgi:hypothetical protein
MSSTFHAPEESAASASGSAGITTEMLQRLDVPGPR